MEPDPQPPTLDLEAVDNGVSEQQQSSDISMDPLDAESGMSEYCIRSLGYIKLMMSHEDWAIAGSQLNGLLPHLPDLESLGYRKKLPSEEVLRKLATVLDQPGQVSFEDIREILYEEAQNDSLDVCRSPDDAAAVSLSFSEGKFQGEGAALLLDKLVLYSRLWRQGKGVYYCPMAAMLNASMTGKSRVVTQLAVDKGVFIFLICLRPSINPAYQPKRTPLIADWATAKNVDKLQFTDESCAFFYKCIVELIDWLNKLPSNKYQQVTEDSGVKLKELAQMWYEYQQQEAGTLWSRVADFVKERRPAVRKVRNSPMYHSEIEKHYKIVELWVSDVAQKITELRELLESKMGVQVDEASQLHLLTVIDEARQLNVASETQDRFGLFRRAMQCLAQNFPAGKGLNSFCLVTDTTSRISNFAPIAEVDFSFRIRSPLAGKGYTLFPPVTTVNKNDVLWNKAKLLLFPVGCTLEYCLWKLRNALVGEVDSDEEPDMFPQTADAPGEAILAVQPLMRTVTAKLLESSQFQSMFGRAAYFPFYRYRKGEGDQGYSRAESGLIELLKTKLLCQFAELQPKALEKKPELLDEEEKPDFTRVAKVPKNPVKVDEMEMAYTQAQAMSVLGAMVSIEVSAASRLASDIAAGHMRLVGAVSKNRAFVYTVESSEPMLGRAAHELVMKETVPWHVLLRKYLSTQVNNSTVDVGNKGEVAVQILLAMAWQKCLENHKESLFPCVSVLEFLGSFLGPSFAEKIKGSPEAVADFQRGYVRVNQIVRAFEQPSLSMAADFFIRSSGISCPPGMPVLDLCLPVFYPSSEACDWKEDPVSKEKMALIGIQVRLWNGGVDESSYWKWVQSLQSLSFISRNPSRPSLGIFIDLGADTSNLSFFNNPVGPMQYVLRVARPSVAAIRESDLRSIAAFRDLLEFNSNITKNTNIDLYDREELKSVFEAAFAQNFDF